MLLRQGKSARTEKHRQIELGICPCPAQCECCSNVPGYQALKCFVTDGDPNGLISEFIQYLVSISTKSSSLLQEQFADVFEALKTARCPESRETHEEVESEEGEESEDQSRVIMKRMKKGLNRRTNKTAPFSMMLQKDRKTCPFIEESM